MTVPALKTTHSFRLAQRGGFASQMRQKGVKRPFGAFASKSAHFEAWAPPLRGTVSERETDPSRCSSRPRDGRGAAGRNLPAREAAASRPGLVDSPAVLALWAVLGVAVWVLAGLLGFGLYLLAGVIF